MKKLLYSECIFLMPGVLACVHMYILYLCAYVRVYMYLYRRACTYVYACACVYVFVCMHIHDDDDCFYYYKK